MNNEDEAKKIFQDYVNAGADLAESVKRNITKDGIIDDATVIALNDFIIATNAIADLQVDFDYDINESDETLN
jgi:hypothetical protein